MKIEWILIESSARSDGKTEWNPQIEDGVWKTSAFFEKRNSPAGGQWRRRLFLARRRFERTATTHNIRYRFYRTVEPGGPRVIGKWQRRPSRERRPVHDFSSRSGEPYFSFHVFFFKFIFPFATEPFRRRPGIRRRLRRHRVSAVPAAAAFARGPP